MNKWMRLLKWLPVVWGALALFPVAHAEEFLDPEVAFKFSARALDANTLEARWQIADDSTWRNRRPAASMVDAPSTVSCR